VNDEKADCVITTGLEDDRRTRKSRAILGVLLWGSLSVSLAWLLGGRHYGDDAIVLLVVALKLGGGQRAAIGLLAILGFAVTFPPLAWPLYGVCGMPLVWLWRRVGPPRAWVGEAFGIGFAQCWLTSPFVRADFGQFGVVVHGLASVLFGLQVLGLAAVLRGTRSWPLLLAAPLAALAATGAEVIRVFVLGWPLLLLSSPAASTPMAQWASVASPFGVSFLLYSLNFLWLPIDAGRRAWLGPISAVCLAAGAWSGGEIIAGRVRFDPLPVRVLLLQPHLAVAPGASRPGAAREVARRLDDLTRRALAAGPPPDLIVWPETSIFRTGVDLEPSGDPGDGSPTLGSLFRDLMPVYRTACLVGAVVQAPDGRLFNSACLITPEGELSRYDKRRLVPGVEGRYTAGRTPSPLVLTTREGRRVRIGLDICYEIHFSRWPWSPGSDRPDVMILLNNESAYRHYPGMARYGTWACQYRAIESRTWQLVDATWARSAVIDPVGRVHAVLPDGPGTLSAGPGVIEARPDSQP
jgi:apolipoprotein N-acyltransferase